MSLRMRLGKIEKILGAKTHLVYLFLPTFDITKTPPEYTDRITSKVLTKEEAGKIKEDFIERNPDKTILALRIVIDDSKIRDSSE